MTSVDTLQTDAAGAASVGVSSRDRLVVGATALALGLSMVAQNAVVIATDAPSYASPIQDVLAYHAANRVPVAIAVGLEALNVPLLLGFLAGLHRLVARRRGAGSTWSLLALVSGAALSAIFALYSAMWIGVVLAAGRPTEPTATLQVLWQVHAAGFALALPALGTTFGGAALGAHAAGLTPRWQRLLGVVGGGLLVASGTANLAIADGSPLIFVGLVGYAAWIVWLLATGVRLIRSRRAHDA